jgi:hypothetical protein
MACLEFHVPQHALAYAGWWAYTRGVMPLLGATASSEWVATARFLGPSIDGFYRRHPLAVQVRWWQDAGLAHVRTRTFLLGTAIVMRAVKGGG